MQYLDPSALSIFALVNDGNLSARRQRRYRLLRQPRQRARKVIDNHLLDLHPTVAAAEVEEGGLPQAEPILDHCQVFRRDFRIVLVDRDGIDRAHQDQGVYDDAHNKEQGDVN